MATWAYPKFHVNLEISLTILQLTQEQHNDRTYHRLSENPTELSLSHLCH